MHDLEVRLAECEADSKRGAKIQAALYRIADAGSASTDVHEFYKLLHEIIGSLMYAGNFFIATLDEATGILSWPYHVDEKDTGEENWAPELYQEGRGVSSYVMRTGNSVHTLTQNEALLQGGEIAIIGAMPEDAVFVPLRADGKALGVLAVQSYTKGIGYTDDDVQILNFVAQHIATALTRARAIAETRQRNAELSIINSIQQGLASKLELQAIIDLVGDKVREIFDAQGIAIGTYDHADRLVHYGYMVQNGRRVPAEPAPFAGMSLHMIKTRRTLVINEDFERRIEDIGSTWIAGMDKPRSAVYVPLLAGETVAGVITIQNLDRENAFSESDVRLLETLASSMSVALENARLFDEVQHRNQEISEALEQETATADILRVIAGSPSDIQPVLEVIAEHAVRLCEGLNSSVYLTDGKLVYEAVSRDASPEARELNRAEYPRPLAYDFSLSSRAILGKAVLNIPDSQNDPTLPELTREYSRVLGMKSILFAPLIKDGEARGALAVSHAETGLFSDKQVALLKTFADQAVIAIENVRLFNETKRLLAETEQRAAELGIINRVQEGLASKLDFGAIIRLVERKSARSSQPTRSISRSSMPRSNCFAFRTTWIRAFKPYPARYHLGRA